MHATHLTACDGSVIPVDPEDFDALALLLGAGVRLQVHRRKGGPAVVLRDYLSDGTSATITLSKFIVGAGPRTEAGTIADALDHRRANLWSRESARKIAWRSKVLNGADNRKRRYGSSVQVYRATC